MYRFSPNNQVSFNSRPHKEVDLRQALLNTGKFLSIHDLTRRSTSSACNQRYALYLSIHDLTRRSTDSGGGAAGGWTFQFTTSQGGRRRCDYFQFPSSFFQFTTSQGGRRYFSGLMPKGLSLSIHDLTRRSTSQTFYPNGVFIFQFTTSQGGRLLSTIPRPSCSPFNSRPHKEVDV